MPTLKLKAPSMTANDYRRVTVRLFRAIDPVTIRLILMFASFIWAGALFLNPKTFDRHGFEAIAWVTTEVVWAIVFLVHGFAVLWRFYDPKSRPVCALVINIYGFLIWTWTTLLSNIVVGSLSPYSSIDWVLCFMSALCVVKTGLKREVVTL